MHTYEVFLKPDGKEGYFHAGSLDAPDDALIEFTFTTAQGASTKLTGTVSFLNAAPLCSRQQGCVPC